MQTYLWIGLGGALGSMARHWSNGAVSALMGVGFPWVTLVINVLGSFIIGFAAATMNAERNTLLDAWERALVTG